MLLALILASGSALLGGALALAVRRRRVLLELTRTFAFAAAAGVVALHLLPEALGALGLRGLFWAAAGFAIPGLLEWRANKLGRGLRARGFSPARVAAEVGFLALVAHSLLEGVALAAAASGEGSHLDLEIALVAHHAPLTAAVILPFLSLVAARGVFLRVLTVALAGALGALGGALAPPGLTDALPQNIAGAIMAGALLHVVADEIRVQQFSARWERAADLLAAIVGAGIAVVSAIFGGSAQSTLAVAFLALVLPCAPALLVSDLIVAIPKRPSRSLAPRPALDAVLVSMRTLGLVAALAELGIALFAWLAAAAFAPGDGRPPLETPNYLSRLLAGAAARNPRRLVVFLLGAAALGLLPPILHIPGLAAAAISVVALGLLSALSSSAAAAIAAAFLSTQLWWVPGPAVLVATLALGPLLLRRAAWRGGSRRRSLGALFTLLIGASAAVLLGRESFEDRVRSAASAVPDISAIADRPLQAWVRAFPVESAAFALMLLLALISLWNLGVRGWFIPLREPDHDVPSETTAATEAIESS